MSSAAPHTRCCRPPVLLNGWIVPKVVHNPPHDNAIELCDEALRRRLPPGWTLRIQSVITTSDSEPDPDLALVRGSPRERGPRLEVADSSLEIDRGTKARVYAAAGIPVYRGETIDLALDRHAVAGLHVDDLLP